MLANLAMEAGELEKAEKLFVNVMRRLVSKGVAQDDNAIVDMSLKLSKIYQKKGDMEKAEAGYKFCVESQEQKCNAAGVVGRDNDTLYLYAKSCDGYARLLLTRKKYAMAESMFRAAYRICLEANGDGSSQCLVLLNDIGITLSLQEKLEEALKVLEDAVRLAEQLKAPELASFQVNLGVLLIQKGLIIEAEKSCKAALGHAHKNKDEDATQEAEACLKSIHDLKASNL
ncbi:unnamed protein product [Darwinula stevensoni]|uniref:Uncharacterized protein n=1 Tax=Darwinula stevensoni TaxID=69355 RepID=A0A7R9A6W7_9CRUS|nr:unnamed protein product [Darwinula stevensoni]CAG0889198.1 unnamed protein product [Darwinula stevensoni]